MLRFKKLTIKDKPVLDKYLKDCKFNTCEYSFTTLLVWRKACDIKFAISEGVLIIKKKDFEENYHFMQPIGYNKATLKELVEELKKYKKENNMEYLFKDVENSFIEDFVDIYGDEAHIEEDIDNFDYIYSKEKLASLSGKKLHGKKNHYNYFIKNFNYSIKDISDSGVVEDCINLAEQWRDENYAEDKYVTYEFEGIKEVLHNVGELDLEGMAVYVDNIISAFTIGEIANENMAIVHFEKGRKDINGIYSFINKTFVERYLNKVDYINREQDLGIEGLRKAKRSYYPIKLEEKYCVNL